MTSTRLSILSISAVLLFFSGFTALAASTFPISPTVSTTITFIGSPNRTLDKTNFTGSASTTAYALTAISANTAGNANYASTASGLAVNGANCAAGQFMLGVNASGAAENCATPVFANADTVDNQHFVWTPQSGSPNYIWGGSGTSYPYLTAYFSVNYANSAYQATNAGAAGSAITGTALNVNGVNCSTGQFATGVDASGAAEGCVTVSGGAGSCTCTGTSATITVRNSRHTTCTMTFNENGLLIATTC